MYILNACIAFVGENISYLMKKLVLFLAIAIYSVVCVNVIYAPQVRAAYPIEQRTTTAAPAGTEITTADEAVKELSSMSNSAEMTKAVKKQSFFSKLFSKLQGGGKSQLIALLLCIFVGGIGIHRFYLGYIWQGVVQLLTLGGCGIWALIDLIRIITGDLQPKDGSYDQTL